MKQALADCNRSNNVLGVCVLILLILGFGLLIKVSVQVKEIKALEGNISLAQTQLLKQSKHTMHLKDQLIKEQTSNHRLNAQNIQYQKERYKRHKELYSLVTVTHYSPNDRGINSDSDPTNTATMSRPIPGKTIAISTELVRMGWLGRRIYVENKGMFIASDRLNPNIKGKQIDVCVSSEKMAYKLGRKENVFACVVLQGDK